jgi:NAD(P)-dependent dehydrogenase (short-subunit alcohol dehydrogenase family)
MTLASKGLLAAAGACVAAALTQELVRRSRRFCFRDKRVLVTGGSRGLGLVLARHLVDAGAKVAITARTPQDLQDAFDELQSRAATFGGEVIAIACDVRKPDDVQHMVEGLLTTWGGMDVLLNVAGIIEVGPLDTMTLQDFHDAMDTNCWGALHTILAVLPAMRQQGWGRIVNIGSIGGKQAIPHLLPYVASKFALVGLSNGLRAELAKDGILVTTANPTLLRTGSPRNALFKGHHRGEYAWFSLGGSLPLVSVNAERAARQVLRACQNGDIDVMIGNWLNPPLWAHRLLPRLTTELFSLVNAVLPGRGGIETRAARGYQSESIVSPSVLTALGDAAARQNNEMRPREGDQGIAERPLRGVIT